MLLSRGVGGSICALSLPTQIGYMIERASSRWRESIGTLKVQVLLRGERSVMSNTPATLHIADKLAQFVDTTAILGALDIVFGECDR